MPGGGVLQRLGQGTEVGVVPGREVLSSWSRMTSTCGSSSNSGTADEVSLFISSSILSSIAL